MPQNDDVTGDPELSIIVPTFNERERLEDLVTQVFAVLTPRGINAEIVVVDDNSPDGTGEIAERLARQFPLRALHRSGKLGLGSAAIDGFGVARAGILGVIDADLSHPPSIIPSMMAVLRETGVDMVVGSRYVPGGSWRNWPFQRVVMSRMACLLARPLTPVRDAMSGLFLVRREAVEGVQIAASGFKIGLEFLLRSRITSIAEIPYTFSDRVGGQSKLTVGEGLGFLTQLRLLYKLRLRRPRQSPLMYRRVAPDQIEKMVARVASGK